MFRIFGLLVLGLCLGAYLLTQPASVGDDWRDTTFSEGWRDISGDSNALMISWAKSNTTNILSLSLSTGDWAYHCQGNDNPNNPLSIQRGIALGKLSPTQLAAVNQWIESLPHSQCLFAVNSLIIAKNSYYRYYNPTARKILPPLLSIFAPNSFGDLPKD